LAALLTGAILSKDEASHVLLNGVKNVAECGLIKDLPGKNNNSSILI
jgi:hypothetical protein